MKYYAVREGKTPGIYDNWDDCRLQVHGFKGAVYKSFPTLEEAEKYFNDYNENPEYMDVEFSGFYEYEGIQIPLLSEPLKFGEVLVYVDGSNNNPLGIIGYGYIVYYRGEVYPGYGCSDQEFLVDLRNVGGEITAVLEAVNIIDEFESVEKIEFRYDYNGIRDWALGSWKANNDGTQLYAGLMEGFISAHNGNVVFRHIDGHTGELGNEAADQLAKLGAKIDQSKDLKSEKQEQEHDIGYFPEFFLMED